MPTMKATVTAPTFEAVITKTCLTIDLPERHMRVQIDDDGRVRVVQREYDLMNGAPSTPENENEPRARPRPHRQDRVLHPVLDGGRRPAAQLGHGRPAQHVRGLHDRVQPDRPRDHAMIPRKPPRVIAPEPQEPLYANDCPILRTTGTHHYGRDNTCTDCAAKRGRPVRNGKE